MTASPCLPGLRLQWILLATLLLIAAAAALSPSASAVAPRVGCGALTVDEETAALNQTVGTQGRYISFNVTLCDVDDPQGNLTAIVESNPAGVWYEGRNATGNIRLSNTFPDNSMVGFNWVNVTICDPLVACTLVSFHVWINNTNDSPVITTSGSVYAVDQDSPFYLQLNASDPDDSTPGAMPTMFTFSDDTTLFEIQPNGVIQFTPTNDQVGTWAVQITVRDDGFPQLADVLQITIRVNNLNDPPILPPHSDLNVTQDVQFTASLIKAVDPDLLLFDRLPPGEQEALVYSDDCALFNIVRVDTVNVVTGAPEPAGQIRITATNAQVGDWECNITVTDRAGARDTILIRIHVNNVNDSPALLYVEIQAAGRSTNVTAPDTLRTYDEDVPLSLIVHIHDPDQDERANEPGVAVNPGEQVTCSILVLFTPSGLVPPTGAPLKPTVDPSSCTTEFTAGNNEVGTFTITYTVRDNAQTSAVFRFQLEIQNINDAPEYARITSPSENFTAHVGENIDLSAYALDIDTPDSQLSFLWEVFVEGRDPAYFAGSTYTWAIPQLAPGHYEVKIQVRVVEKSVLGGAQVQARVNGTLVAVAETPLTTIATVVAPAVPNGTSISFAAPASGGVAPYSYAWDFGDGGTSTEAAPSHDYGRPGRFTTTVTVTDATGNSTSQSVSVTVAAEAPPVSSGSLFASPLLMVALAGLAVFGMVAGGTQVGRYFLLFAATSAIFSKLRRPSPLDHFVRGRLYQLIENSPGIHFSELRRQAKLANGAATHHLRVLEEAGLVRVIVDGMRTRFYPTDKPLTDDTYGLTDRDRSILESVVAVPGISQTDLSERAAVSLPTVGRSINRLAALGYVTTERDGRTVNVFPRPVGEVPAALGRPPWPDEGA